ncbi:cob(I)yrinic acid a,c-diamide adenosyltransferase [[Clostridium] colinum]|uniref:cob(I)yrinic acid a,c-diamide adenosyltransferase n=1 Tax=[Clostridium] colinum TaxID=36835 RepID=UPI002025631F|nr:cob(I)yrinic acid a,c-diamide adenosyltransferase [[Clostridium] colinum]
MERGYLQVYTGNGKGKTTCMLGLTLRASGAGKKIYIGQFMKDDEYSEIKAIREFLPNVTVEQYGTGKGFAKKGNLKEYDITCGNNGYDRAIEVLKQNEYDIYIFDEINVAVYMEILTEKQILDLIDIKPTNAELILTGRYALDSVKEKADLVTEMKEIKHYYKQGVMARVGIEK